MARGFGRITARRIKSSPLTAEQFASADPHARIAIAVLRALFGDAYARDFGIRLWDGTRIDAECDERFVFVVNAPGALRAAFTPPLDLSPGRAFGAGLIDVEGDLVYAADALYRASAAMRARDLVRLVRLLRRLPKIPTPQLREARLRGRIHSRARDRAAIGFHYDQPVEFYRSFLGPDMIYSCAYFDDGVESLDAAQAAKLDYTLRKLRLRAGERLLDIGCGWGALVIRAAQLGAHALGHHAEPAAVRRGTAAHRGCRRRRLARVELRDYRELRASGSTRS